MLQAPPRNRFLKFLKEIDGQVSEGLDVHIVMDNYPTHKTPKVKAWLARRPHYHVHFTPTSASWINQVGLLNSPESKPSEASNTSVRQLAPNIRTSIGLHNKVPSPFNGPSLLTRFWLPSNASATKPSRLYVANFRFT